MRKRHEGKQAAQPDLRNEFSKLPKNQHIITVDVARYQHLLDEEDLTEEEKQEFLQTIWNIVVEFVSFGWGVHPLQHVEKTCGKPEKTACETALFSSDTLYLDDQILSENLLMEAACDTEADEKGVPK